MVRRYAAGALLLAAALATPSGVRAQDKPAAALPLNVVQVQPVGKLIADIKAVAAVFGGDAAVKKFDEQLNEKLGEKGLAGLDLGRPVVGFQVLKDDLSEQSWVALVPVTGEAEFLDLLKRADVEAVPNAKDKTLYEVTLPEKANLGDKEVLFRVVGATAYFGFNVDAADLDPKKLPTAADVTIPNEGAWAVNRTYLSRAPKDIKKQLTAAIDKSLEQFKGLPLPPEFKDRFEAAMKVSVKYTMLQYEQGDVTTTRLNLDPKTLQFTTEYSLTPKAGTALAADLAARKPTTNLFGGLLTKDTTIGFATKIPLFLPELRDGVADLVALGQEQAGGQIPDEFKPVADAALAGVTRTAKGGNFDLAAALTGPDADGKFGLSVGVAFDDPSKLEAELKKLHATADDNVKNLIKLDFAKVGGVSVHKLNVGAFFPPEVQAVFGDEATVAIAFSPKGIMITAGKDSVGQMKAAFAATGEAAAADVLDVKLNPKRMRRLADARGDENMKKMFPTASADELRSIAKITVAGGKELTARILFDLKAIPKITPEE